MASNFWIGASVSVTANSKLVTVLSSSDDITKIKEGAAFVASNYSIPFEVNRTYNDGSNDIIELKENWSGATSSSVSATVVVGPGAIASTREAIVNLISAYEAFEALVSPTVIANGLAQRTATGQLKTANAVNNDEAVAKGQFNSLTQSYLNNFGLGQYTQQRSWPNSHIDNCNGVASGVYRTDGSIAAPDQTAIVYFSRRNAGQLQQILISGYDSGNANTFQWRNSNGGSDSTPTWGEWKIVYHSGISVNPVDFGIGGQGANFDSDDANNGINSGIYRATSSTANIPISGTSTVIVTRSYNVVTQLFCNGSIYYFRRSVDNGSNWDGWREIYHSGNSVNPLDYGIGAHYSVESSLKSVSADELKGGLYTGYEGSNTNATTGDNPFPTGGSAYSLLNITGVDYVPSNYKTQIAIGYSHGLTKFRYKATNTFSDWEDIFTSVNSVNPLDYNIGKVTSQALNTPADSYNTNNPGGLWRGLGGSTVGSPDNVAYNLGSIAIPASTGTVYLAARNTSSPASDEIWYGNYRSNEANLHWNRLYGSHNTNFNEFGGNAGNDVIATGEAVTSTVARFYLPINMQSQPTSITLTESVSIYRAGTALEAGVTSVVLSALSSKKVAVIDVTCSVTLTVHDQLNLRVPTSTAKIAING